MLERMKKMMLAVALAATGMVGVAAPAEARDRYHRGGGDDAAIAVGAGIIGLAIGAAIASDNRRDRYYRGGYYDGGYYRSYPNYYYYDSYPRYRNHYYRDHRRYYRRSHRNDWRGGRSWGGRNWRDGDSHYRRHYRY